MDRSVVRLAKLWSTDMRMLRRGNPRGRNLWPSSPASFQKRSDSKMTKKNPPDGGLEELGSGWMGGRLWFKEAPCNEWLWSGWLIDQGGWTPSAPVWPDVCVQLGCSRLKSTPVRCTAFEVWSKRDEAVGEWRHARLSVQSASLEVYL